MLYGGNICSKSSMVKHGSTYLLIPELGEASMEHIERFVFPEVVDKTLFEKVA